jgi:hypothetical protein
MGYAQWIRFDDIPHRLNHAGRARTRTRIMGIVEADPPLDLRAAVNRGEKFDAALMSPPLIGDLTCPGAKI